MTKLMTAEQRRAFFDCLHHTYPNPKCELKWTNTWELIVAIILSAQTTDKNVNLRTPALFQAANTPEKTLKLGEEKVKSYLTSINYYNNKTRSIMALAQILHNQYHDQMPTDFNTLLTLPGIGRKTASVFLNVAYNAPYIGVDTHVFRLVHRLGICTGSTPEEVQDKLQKIVPDKYKPSVALALVLLGRYVCTAKKLKCGECPMYPVCCADEKQEKTK